MPLSIVTFSIISVSAACLDGDFTFFKGGRKSQNDICLSNAAGLQRVEDFSIHKIGWNFSDHFPISVTVRLDLYDSTIPLTTSADILTSVKDEGTKRPGKTSTCQVD